jgi:hypothetical protein
MTVIVLGSSSKAKAASHKSKPQKTAAIKSGKASAAVLPTASRNSAGCGQCDKAQQARKQTVKKSAKTAKKLPCHPKGYVDPKVAKNFSKAMRELNRAGIQPKITSTWRSSQYQARLHKCSRSSRCRRAHPGLYYALPAGQSLHEAGFAVDISGVAAGPRGNKRLTSRGRRIVNVMEKNGFDWRYGLADPAHFEADPRRHGYRSVKQAINRNQTRCTVKGLTKASAKKSGKTASLRATGKKPAQKSAYSRTGAPKSRSNRG